MLYFMQIRCQYKVPQSTTWKLNLSSITDQGVILTCSGKIVPTGNKILSHACDGFKTKVISMKTEREKVRREFSVRGMDFWLGPLKEFIVVTLKNEMIGLEQT